MFPISFDGFLFVTVIILVLKLSYIWPVRAPSSCLLCPFGSFPSFFENFFTFWYKTATAKPPQNQKSYTLILCFPCSSFRAGHFFRAPASF